jgi:hypothetical protein
VIFPGSIPTLILMPARFAALNSRTKIGFLDRGWPVTHRNILPRPFGWTALRLVVLLLMGQTQQMPQSCPSDASTGTRDRVAPYISLRGFASQVLRNSSSAHVLLSYLSPLSLLSMTYFRRR